MLRQSKEDIFLFSPLPQHKAWGIVFSLKVGQEHLLVSIMTWQIPASGAKKQLSDYVAAFQNKRFWNYVKRWLLSLWFPLALVTFLGKSWRIWAHDASVQRALRDVNIDMQPPRCAAHVFCADTHKPSVKSGSRRWVITQQQLNF